MLQSLSRHRLRIHDTTREPFFRKLDSFFLARIPFKMWKISTFSSMSSYSSCWWSSIFTGSARICDVTMSHTWIWVREAVPAGSGRFRVGSVLHTPIFRFSSRWTCEQLLSRCCDNVCVSSVTVGCWAKPCLTRRATVDKPWFAYLWFCRHLPRSVTAFTWLKTLFQ